MTLVLDTNVVSELMRNSPHPSVKVWFSNWSLEDLFFSTIGEAELRYGASILKSTRRREAMFLTIEEMLRDTFGNRILPFDRVAAQAYAEVSAKRFENGLHIPLAVCILAAIALSNDMSVVTRNVKDFVSTGVEVINPWEES